METAVLLFESSSAQHRLNENLEGPEYSKYCLTSERYMSSLVAAFHDKQNAQYMKP